MARFNLNQILSDASKAAASGGEPIPRPAESRIERISVFDLVPSEENFYSMREIDELKAAIEIAGKVLQNLVVVPMDGGKYKVIAGHRRRLASIALVEEGKPQFEFVPCDIEPNEEAAEDQEVRDGLMLIVTNSQREKTAWDKIEEVRFLREVLEKARTKPRFVAVLQNIVATAFGGAEVQADGTRDFIAKVLHTSTTQIGRYDAIIRNLCPAFKAELQEDRINISTAYELSGLNPADQQAAFEDYRESGEISIRTARERKQDTPPAAEVKQPPAPPIEYQEEPPASPVSAPQPAAQTTETKRREEMPPTAETPAEGRTEPQGQPEAEDKPPAPSSPPPMSAERADNQEMSVDRAALQLKNLLEYCMGKGESFDHSRDWTADVHALYIAIDKLAD
ncbi:ParB/RepB/Spo0J family partition protein [Acutalibacter intestini]|jgi:ParB family chromosome partitioning protein|uniref:ParB/RepB/Spo0J family partition protein n=1 Tax=Acutalibacter intestini TaxID=3093659 RepID=UPI002AC99976|nr:ParB N-terminal domain-containing protein [Acutalibacter sp. M00204]